MDEEGQLFELLNRGYEFIMEYINDQLDGGDILLIMEVINLDGQWIQGYAEDIIFLECWRIV
jgi:hypothetical protein